MKSNKSILIIIVCFISYCAVATMVVKAQPQWKFHVAYEDATGAKDTIWFIWDTTATFFGADTLLGETTAIFNYDEFNVWTYNIGLTWNDSIKIVAHPYEYSFGHEIEAMNFELPITICWDTSLLHASFLPPQPVGWINHARMDNDYFFMINNYPIAHQFDMTITDHIIVPDTNLTNSWFWNPVIHFPVSLYLFQDPTFSIPLNNGKGNRNIHIYPNPAHSEVIISGIDENAIVEVSIYNSIGQRVIHKREAGHKVDVSSLQHGMYVVEVVVGKHRIREKLIVKRL